MLKYPIHAETEQEKTGYVKYAEAIKWRNQSFFDGFIAALCETAEDYEAITTEERITAILSAIEKCALLRRESHNSPDLSGGGGTRVAIIHYKPLQSLVAA